MEMAFASPVSDMSAYFTWAAPLTFDMYSDLTFSTPVASFSTTGNNLGTSTLIQLPYMFQSVRITDAIQDSMAMDDLSFTPDNQTVIPEPSTLILFGTAYLAAALKQFRQKAGRRTS
jgi:hypothetical protein